MSMKTLIRTALIDLTATLMNSNSPVPRLSYPWLNRAAWRIVQTSELAGRRPQYVWGMLQSAALAKTLGRKGMVAIELGVAGGRGLISMEAAAYEISRLIDLPIEVVGFDTGKGLPRSEDLRDLPNIFGEGDYAMDFEALRKRLQLASLVIGPIRDTVPEFLRRLALPIGFISCDVDLYTSTVEAFPLFETLPSLLLPRAYMYFDDIIGLTFSDWNGERLAIREFNERHPTRKIGKIHGLRFDLPWPLSTAKWSEMMFILHSLDHPDYGRKDHLIPEGVAPLERTGAR